MLNMLRARAEIYFATKLQVLIFHLFITTTFQHMEDLFTSPIRMTEVCGHNFCHSCISFHTAGQDQPEWFCPECRTAQVKFPDDLARNRIVERAVESLKSPKTNLLVKPMCGQHNLELTLCKLHTVWVIWPLALPYLNSLFKSVLCTRKINAWNVILKKHVTAND